VEPVVSDRFGVGQRFYGAASTLCPAALSAPIAASSLSTGTRMKSVSHVEKTKRLIPAAASRPATAATTPTDATSKGPAISKQRKPPCASTSGGTALSRQHAVSPSALQFHRHLQEKPAMADLIKEGFNAFVDLQSRYYDAILCGAVS
jgi:hypothetical protein